MFISPVIQRELRMALRRFNPQRSRLIAASIASAFSLVCLLIAMASPQMFTEMHFYLFSGCVALAVLTPCRIAIGLIADERENQTLELLFLTGMSPAELFVGKVLGALLVASCDLLAIMPFLALPFLSGGLSLQLFLASVVCVPIILLFVLSVTILSSVLCSDETMGVMMVGGILALVCGAVPAPYLLGSWLMGKAQITHDWLCTSPAYAVAMVANRFSFGSPTEFWLTTLWTIVWTLFLFSLAAIILQRTWRSAIDSTSRPRWSVVWRRLIRGTEAQREQLRDLLFPWHAYQWLAQRDRKPVVLAWTVVTAIIAAWCLGWALWPQAWPNTTNFFITAFLFITAVQTIVAHTAGRRIGSDRRDGSLELLLTTPITPHEIVDGQIAAIDRQFRPVRLGLLILCGLMATSGIACRSWTPSALFVYLAIWLVFFVWASRTGKSSISKIMWIAVNTGRPTFAAFSSRRNGWTSWLWVAFQLRNLGRLGTGLGGFPFGTTIEVVITSFALVVFGILYYAFKDQVDEMRIAFARELRSIAQEPVPDRHDPGYKAWKDLTQRFPRNL